MRVQVVRRPAQDGIPVRTTPRYAKRMTTQIAVKLSDDLVARLDELVADGAFASRSAAVRQGLQAVIAAHRRAAIDRAYEEGYGEAPETDEEIEQARRLAVEAIREEPWEKWW